MYFPIYSVFKSIGIAESDFIGRRFARKDFKWRQGVVYGQWRMYESDFLGIEVAVAILKEQKQIGEYFATLDTLIKQT